MKTLAVTGSSGSGKTTVSKLFLRLDGTYLINTDELARDMAENDDKYLNEIILTFGLRILNEFKGLNRKKLSDIITKDDDARKQLNDITKRNMLPRIDRMINENSDKKLIILDIPILYENNLENYFDKVLAVIADRNKQLERIIERDDLNVSKAEARLKIQLDNDFFSEHADFVIENNDKNIDQLYKEVEKIYYSMIK